MSDPNPSESLDSHAADLRFEAAWMAHRPGGLPPRWQDYLPADWQPGSADLLFLLAQVDIEYRVKIGLPALLAERYFEHPRLRQSNSPMDAGREIELIRWEYQRRWQAGQRPRRDEYQAAFPQYADALGDLRPHSHCPRCGRVIDLDETQQTSRCPACESERQQSTIPLDGGSLSEEAHGLDLRGYELSERLGGGGMGDVYCACDPALGRDLAVKVIKADYQDSPTAQQRFLREARITGSLQHPGIVPVHNLGRLEDGRLHYTMRLVRGQTFADILKEEGGKPQRWPELLTIFVKICQAVAYAHSRKVIHRDLKPSNVMVGRFGEVQVMDWGLAKLLSPEDKLADPEGPAGTRVPTDWADTPPELTRTHQALGTPAYMPPEQARGEWDKVDERADVFALGAILCQILTGRPPYAGGHALEVMRRAEKGDQTEVRERLERCGAEAALLELCRACLTPEREGRPREGEEVARRVTAYQAEVQERLRRAELERAEAVVTAREERKRRRWVWAALVVLLAGATISTWQWVRARNFAEAEKEVNELAQKRLISIGKVNDVLASIFSGLDPRADENKGLDLHDQLTRHLKEAAAQLDEAAIEDPLTVARLRSKLGRSLIELSEARPAIELLSKARTTLEAQLGADHAETLKNTKDLALAYQDAGEADMALTLYKQTLTIREANLGPDHPDTLESLDGVAQAYQELGQVDKALPLFEQVVAKRKEKLGPDDRNTLSSMCGLALAYKRSGQLGKALPLYELTLAKMKVQRGSDHPDTLVIQNNLVGAYYAAGQLDKALPLSEQVLAKRKEKLGPDNFHTLTSMSDLGLMYWVAGQRDKGMPLLEQVLVKRKDKLGSDHPDTLQSMNNLAFAYEEAGQLARSITLYEQAVAKMQVKIGPDHPDTLNTMCNLASTYMTAGRLDKAIPLHEQALAKRKAKLGPDHPETLLSMHNLAKAYQADGQVEKALPLFEQAWAKLKIQLGPDHPNALTAVGNLAQAHQAVGQPDRGEPLLRELLERRRKKFGPESEVAASTLALLGSNLLAQQKYAEAETALRECLAIRAKKLPDDWATFNTRSSLGEAVWGQKKYAEAEPLLLEGYKGMKRNEGKIPPRSKVRLIEALERLVRLYEATGKKDEATSWRKKLVEAKPAQQKSKPGS